ncbi:MAG: PAS domain-containing protein [Peptococcales bacterium]|jgi:PAS domain S-box-containing protein
MKKLTLNFEPAFPRSENQILEVFGDNYDKIVVKKGLLAAILDNLPFSILVLDDKSKIVYLNSSLCNLTGYETSELHNLTLKEFAKLVICENSYDFTRYPKILAGEIIRDYIYTFRHKNGNHISVKYSSYPLRVESDARPIGCLCVIEEV